MKLKCLLFYFICIQFTITAQSVFVPLSSGIYNFLERNSLKHIIILSDAAKPYSRIEAASYLKLIDGQRMVLSEVEKEELDWYKREFADELKLKDERWFLYKYTDSLFHFRVSPSLGVEFSSIAGKPARKQWWGVSVYSSISNWFSMFLNFRDNGEYGSGVDKNKSFSPQTGASFIKAPNGIEYSDVRGGVCVDWQWGSISLEKDYFTLGSGKFGQVIHSTKAPSYPFIRFILNPVSWLKFNYIHGWLNSQVVDSVGYYYRTDPVYKTDAEKFVPKYIAINFLTITPFPWLDFSLGNSSVYKGAFKPEMLIPFMFFKYLDRDLGKGSIEDGNGAFFFDASVKYWKNYQLYSTLFVDVTEIRNILKNNWANTWTGFTAGVKRIDLLTENLDLTCEYTRINPWVYEHKDSTTTYKHLNFVLGHWIGQNADQLRLQLDYQYLKNLKFTLYSEVVRKGGLKDIGYYAYTNMTKMDFLYSPKRIDKRIGISVYYEYIHDLIAKFNYEYSNIKDDDSGRTQSYLIGAKNNFSLSLQYGL